MIHPLLSNPSKYQDFRARKGYFIGFFMKMKEQIELRPMYRWAEPRVPYASAQ